MVTFVPNPRRESRLLAVTFQKLMDGFVEYRTAEQYGEVEVAPVCTRKLISLAQLGMVMGGSNCKSCVRAIGFKVTNDRTTYTDTWEIQKNKLQTIEDLHMLKWHRAGTMSASPTSYTTLRDMIHTIPHPNNILLASSTSAALAPFVATNGSNPVA